MQVSDVILTQISKCMASGAIVAPGEIIEVPFSACLCEAQVPVGNTKGLQNFESNLLEV